jgi:hypothetical protein
MYIFTLGEDCEISIGFQDFGESGRDPMTWEEYRIVNFKPFITIKPKYPIYSDVVVRMTKEQALKLKQALDQVWSEDALEWHDKQSGGEDNDC